MKLVRQLQSARRHWILAAAQLTGVGTWILVGMFAVFVAPKRVMCMFSESKLDVAKMTVHVMAHEAYPQWLVAHPGERCPRDIQALTDYMDYRDVKDPWGQPYSMTCCPASGPLIVTSPGEDGRYGTADDIRSDN